MNAMEIMKMANDQGADCCEIFNLLMENDYEQIADIFGFSEGKPSPIEMARAFQMAKKEKPQ
jgi:hypothetical protein